MSIREQGDINVSYSPHPQPLSQAWERGARGEQERSCVPDFANYIFYDGCH